MLRLMKYRLFYFLLSGFLVGGSLLSLALFGLKPAIDFTGGTLIELKVKEGVLLELSEVNKILTNVYSLESIQTSGNNSYLLRGGTIDNYVKDQVIAELSTSYGSLEVLRFETLGPALGRELLTKMSVAIGLVAVIITLYIWWKFDKLKFGISAVLAMFHDSIILLGSFSLLGYFLGVEVDVLFVTALLTTLSFSIHDTIVVYDRIREKQHLNPSQNFDALVDAAVLETFARSINNSMTIIFVLASLVLLGGQTIRWFAVALLIGAIVGTYSSTFVAAPLLLLWKKK